MTVPPRPRPASRSAAPRFRLALLDGEEAVAHYRAMFRAACPEDHVRALLVQAIDPLLLRVVLGPELAGRWVPALERYSAGVRRRSPATFLDFDRVWRQQRRRWQPLVGEGSTITAEAAQQAAVAPETSAAENARRPSGDAAAAAAGSAVVPESSPQPARPRPRRADRCGPPLRRPRSPIQPACSRPDPGVEVVSAAGASADKFAHVFDPWRDRDSPLEDWESLHIGIRSLRVPADAPRSR